MRNDQRGYTLMEMVSVMMIMSVIGLVSSYAIVESMKTYALVAPSIDASYQSRLAAERMRRDLRELSGAGTITTMTATAITFDDNAGNTLAYALSGTDLLRNGDLLARGVTSFAIAYRKSDGTAATLAADLHLVEVDVTVQVADQARRLQITVFPRALSS